MQALLEFAPLVVFLVAYYLGDFYIATGALMAAMVVLVAVGYLRQGRISTMHAVSAGLVLVFGAATLMLRDQRFIQWKPTVFFWALALAFLASRWIGERPLVARLLGPALGPESQVAVSDWQRLNLLWVVFYAMIGALNVAVARMASQDVWVNFKVFGLTALTLAFIAAQVPWLLKRADAEPSKT